jgi:NTE family protein
VSRALVLGAGGVTGVAWELGVLRSLEAGGSPVTDADLVVGTSAGSLVGAQVTSGVALAELVERQLDPPDPTWERTVEFDLATMASGWVELAQQASGPQDFRARVGARALNASALAEDERMEVIISRLPVRDWPARPLLITAVDVGSGEFVIFDRDAGVPLPLAVAASCAVPMVWPPVTIDGHRYMDGGLRSVTNVDLAAGHDTVLVIAPLPNPGMGPLMPGIGSELRKLRPEARVLVVNPDEAALDAFGPNVLDPARRADAARAGLAQGERLVAEVAALDPGGGLSPGRPPAAPAPLPSGRSLPAPGAVGNRIAGVSRAADRGWRCWRSPSPAPARVATAPACGATARSSSCAASTGRRSCRTTWPTS